MITYYSFDNSKCHRGWLHDLRPVESYVTYVRERCEKCKKDFIFSTAPGRNTNLRYLSYHIKNALTYDHPLFKREYPHIKTQ